MAESFPFFFFLLPPSSITFFLTVPNLPTACRPPWCECFSAAGLACFSINKEEAGFSLFHPSLCFCVPLCWTLLFSFVGCCRAVPCCSYLSLSYFFLPHTKGGSPLQHKDLMVTRPLAPLSFLSLPESPFSRPNRANSLQNVHMAEFSEVFASYPYAGR